MKNPKYHVYLTNEERSEVLKSLIDLKNDMIARGKYTDVIDEVITKLCRRLFCVLKGNLNFFEKFSKSYFKNDLSQWVQVKGLFPSNRKRPFHEL